jgi:hypothetical protein
MPPVAAILSQDQCVDKVEVQVRRGREGKGFHVQAYTRTASKLMSLGILNGECLLELDGLFGERFVQK